MFIWGCVTCYDWFDIVSFDCVYNLCFHYISFVILLRNETPRLGPALDEFKKPVNQQNKEEGGQDFVRFVCLYVCDAAYI